MQKIYAGICFWMFLLFHASAQIVTVSTAGALQTALNNAAPGQTIRLLPGTYLSNTGFSVPANINGTSSQPITLTGPKTAIITTNKYTGSYGLYLQGNDYWVIKGFTISKAAKCLMLDYSSYNLIDSMRITKSGSEALHLRRYSSFNTVTHCFLDSTGKNPSDSLNGYAEALYVGSANSNWGTYTGGNPDTCNSNTVSYNTFGSNILSENVDIKEGTYRGILSNNTFSGIGVNSFNSADSYIDVKGDYWNISCNVGKGNGPFLKDGFQSHVNKLTNGTFGDYNTFSNNVIDMTGSTGSGTTGWAISAEYRASAGVTHNVVCTNNIVTNSISGLSRYGTSTCSTSSCNVMVLSLHSSFENSNHHIAQNSTSSDKLHFFPNPISKDQLLKISGLESGNSAQVVVFDLYGKPVLKNLSEDIQKNGLALHLEPGYYLIGIENNPAGSFATLVVY